MSLPTWDELKKYIPPDQDERYIKDDYLNRLRDSDEYRIFAESGGNPAEYEQDMLGEEEWFNTILEEITQSPDWIFTPEMDRIETFRNVISQNSRAFNNLDQDSRVDIFNKTVFPSHVTMTDIREYKPVNSAYDIANHISSNSSSRALDENSKSGYLKEFASGIADTAPNATLSRVFGGAPASILSMLSGSLDQLVDADIPFENALDAPVRTLINAPNEILFQPTQWLFSKLIGMVPGVKDYIKEKSVALMEGAIEREEEYEQRYPTPPREELNPFEPKKLLKTIEEKPRDFGRFIGDLVASLPEMAVTAGVGTVSPSLAISLTGLLQGGEPAIEAFRETGKIEGKTQLDAAKISGALEYLPLGKFLNRLGAKKAGQTFTQWAGGQIANIAKQAGEEAVTEGLQDITSQLASAWIKEEAPDIDMARVGEAMLGGLALGGVFGGAGSVISTAQKSPDVTTDTEAVDQIAEKGAFHTDKADILTPEAKPLERQYIEPFEGKPYDQLSEQQKELSEQRFENAPEWLRENDELLRDWSVGQATAEQITDIPEQQQELIIAEKKSLESLGFTHKKDIQKSKILKKPEEVGQLNEQQFEDLDKIHKAIDETVKKFSLTKSKNLKSKIIESKNATIKLTDAESLNSTDKEIESFIKNRKGKERRVIFFESNKDLPFDGIQIEPGVIALRSNSPIEQARGTALHEIVHELKNENPLGFLELAKIIKESSPQKWEKSKAMAIAAEDADGSFLRNELDNLLDHYINNPEELNKNEYNDFESFLEESVAYYATINQERLWKNIARKLNGKQTKPSRRSLKEWIHDLILNLSRITGIKLLSGEKYSDLNQIADLFGEKVTELQTSPAEFTKESTIKTPLYSMSQSVVNGRYGDGLYLSKINSGSNKFDKSGNPLEHRANVSNLFPINEPISKNEYTRLFKNITSGAELSKIGEVLGEDVFGEKVYDELLNYLDSSEIANDFLEDFGYDGIKVNENDIVVFSNANAKIATPEKKATNRESRNKYQINKSFMMPGESGSQLKDVTMAERKAASWINQYKRLETLQRQVAKATGEYAEVNEHIDTFLAAENYASRAGNQIDVVEKLTKELTEVVRKEKPIGMKGEEWLLIVVNDFLQARHAKERNASVYEKAYLTPKKNIEEKLSKTKDKKVIKNLKNKLAELESKKSQYESGSGLTNKEADTLLRKFKKQNLVDWKETETGRVYTGRLGNVANSVDKITKHKIDLLRKFGVLSEAEYNALNQYKYYVPLKGAMERGGEPELNSWFNNWIKQERGVQSVKTEGFSAPSKERRALGRLTSIPDPIIPNLVADTQVAAVKAEKNKVGNAFLNFARENKNAKNAEGKPLFEISKVKKKRIFDKKTGEIKERTYLDAGEDIFSTIENGQVVHIKVNDSELVSALKNLNAQKVDVVTKNVSKFMRWLGRMHTQYNPKFIAPNFFRDIGTAFFTLTKPETKEAYFKIIKDAINPKNIKELHNAVRGKRSEYADLYKRYRDSGGKIEFWTMIQPQKLGKNINDAIKDGVLSESKRKAGKSLAFIKDLLTNVNTSIENAIRFSTFKWSVTPKEEGGLGYSDAKAARLARNVTIDFTRKGDSQALGFVNSWYLFANANIQGAAQIYNTTKYSNTAKAMMLSLIPTAFTYAYMARLFSGKDPEDEVENWDKIGDYIKRRNIVITGGMLGQEPTSAHFKVPLPYGFNLPWVIGTSLADAALSDQTTYHQAAVSMVDAGLGAFNPLGSADLTDWRGFLQLLAPTVGDPLIDVAVNRKFHGGPVYPEDVYRQGIPSNQRYFNSTSRISIEGTKALAELFGGTKVSKPEIPLADINPGAVDHLFNQYIGGAFNTLLDGVNLIEKLLSGKDIDINHVPVVDRFMGQENEFYIPRKYYMNIEEIKRAKETYDYLNSRMYKGKKNEDYDPVAAKQFAERHRALLNLASKQKLFEKNIKKEKNEERKRKLMVRFNRIVNKERFK